MSDNVTWSLINKYSLIKSMYRDIKPEFYRYIKIYLLLCKSQYRPAKIHNVALKKSTYFSDSSL